MAKNSTKRKLHSSVAPLHIVKAEPLPLKIDIGCGKSKEEGWDGIDALPFGQKYQIDVRKGLPFKDETVDAVRSNHFVEHLTGAERVPFFNELYRVMKVGAIATIITPNWTHDCAYGDPTHQWPPMSGWYALYLNKDWRAANAPHVGFTCDFDGSVAASWDGRLQGRNPEFITAAMASQVNAMRDLIVNLTKRAK